MRRASTARACFAQTWFITLPALRWPISFVTIYQMLSLLVSFEYILLLTKGGPFYDTTVYALYIYRRAFESGQYGYGAALALFLIVIGAASSRCSAGASSTCSGSCSVRASRCSEMAAVAQPRPAGASERAVDWSRVAARARTSRRARAAAVYAFLIAVSLPIILPYFWLITIAFSREARRRRDAAFCGGRWRCSCRR